MSAYMEDPEIRAKLKELTERELTARRLDFDDLNTLQRFQIRSEVSNALATELVETDIICLDQYEEVATALHWSVRDLGV